MKLFEASDRLIISREHANIGEIEKALRSFLEFHQAEYMETAGGSFRFTVPALVISSRKKPLHRFQSGVIKLQRLPEGDAEVSFDVRLSLPNIIGSIASVILALLFAAVFFRSDETSVWWSLGAAAAGPVIAYTAKDQCVSRLRTALMEAASLAGRRG